MSKKGNKSAMLSPENYIRQRARTLPLYECRINSDWKESGLASIVVARRHTNGNVTACSYLVDTYCLGVKDSVFFFSRSAQEYQELIEYYNEQFQFDAVDYALVHNIILAAEEYAEELGFMPCKSYQQTTRFMLEEDSDDIELMEIECGKDGKPALILTGEEDVATVKRLKDRLEARVGAGNYTCIVELDEDDLNGNLTDEELKFCELFDRYDDLDEATRKEVAQLGENIMESMVSEERCDYYSDIYDPLLRVKLVKRKVTPEFMGLPAGSELPDKTAVKHFVSAISSSYVDAVVASANLKKLVKLLPNHPATQLADLLLLRHVDEVLFDTKLKQIADEYPGYGLLQMVKDATIMKHQVNQDKGEAIVLEFDKYFGGRSELHDIEMFEYLREALWESVFTLDLDQALALMLVIDRIKLGEDLKQSLMANSLLSALTIVREFLEDK